MASSRGERLQSRLRGAQRHQVGDVDFGFSLPIVPEEGAAQAQTRTTRRSQGQGKADPTSTSQLPPSRRAGNAASAKSTQKRSAPAATPATTNANISAKRQKLDHPLPLTQRPSPRNRTVGQDGSPNQIEASEISGLDVTGEGDSSLPEIADIGVYDESMQMIPAPRSARKGRVPVAPMLESRDSLQKTLGRASVDLGEAIAQARNDRLQPVMEMSTPKTRTGAQTGPARTKPKSSAKAKGRPGQSSATTTGISKATPTTRRPSDALDELSPNISSGIVITPKGKARQEVFSDNEEQHDDEAEEAEEIDDAQAARFLQQHRASKIKPGPSKKPPAGRSTTVSQTQAPSTSHPSPKQRTKKSKSITKASPAVQRQGTKKPKKTSQSKPTPSTASQPSTSTRGEIINIAVHRLDHIPTYDDIDPDDADILAHDDQEYEKLTKRPAVNPIDVLSQICEEIITSAIETLEEGGANAEDTTARREYRTKLRAVEAFQEELRIRLVELTLTHTAHTTLQKRLKSKLKEKLALRTELLDLRAQRQKIALEMDSIRISHENAAQASHAQAALNTAFQDIEVAVARGRESHHHRPGAAGGGSDADWRKERDDLPTRIADVAAEVSCQSADGGMLKRIREFNAFLERAAVALEGR